MGSPLPAGVLYSLGVVLSPAAGAAPKALSTLIVAINARFLYVKRDEPQRAEGEPESTTTQQSA